MSKKRRKSAVEKTALKMARSLVEDLGYDAEQDWGAMCLTFVRLRPGKTEGEHACVTFDAGTRIVYESDPDRQPIMDQLLKRGLAKATGVSQAKAQAEVVEEGIANVVEEAPLPLDGTQEAADAAFDAFVAREEGRIQ